MDAKALRESFPDAIPLPAEFCALCDWVSTNGYPISEFFELREHDDETIRLWFGSKDAIGHLAQFGAGPDGSLYCVWRSPSGRMAIVHMGSEGQNNFVLASTSIDFLRLLAIGYDEIGFADLDSSPMREDADANVNPRFQQWVSSTFKVTVPVTGSEIVQPARAENDDFQKWVNDHIG